MGNSDRGPINTKYFYVEFFFQTKCFYAMYFRRRREIFTEIIKKTSNVYLKMHLLSIKTLKIMRTVRSFSTGHHNCIKTVYIVHIGF